MPDVSDVKPTSHDRHDPLLMAALAAGDLAGTDRDHATTLIHTCAECATLHADLIAIARATTSVPPPILTRPRDFRLTPEQAARLRPSGWRRVIGAFASPRLAFTRPLAIGLTTIGLAGLLVTNIHLGFGLGSASSAAAPANVPEAQGLSRDAGSAAGPEASGTGSDRLGAVAAPAASVGSVPAAVAPSAAVAGPSAAASGGPVPVSDSGGTTTGSAAGSSPKTAFTGGATGSAAPSAAAAPSVALLSPTFGSSAPVEPAPTQDLRTILFVAVVLVGLGLLVLRRIARRAIAP